MCPQEGTLVAEIVDVLPLSVELAPSESKVDTAQVEDSKSEPQSPLRSHYADWPKSKVIRKFWRLYCFGLAASIAGMYMGYCLSAPGAVVANEGFINQFGTVLNEVTGQLELDAKYVSLWSGIQYAAQILSQAVSPLSGDRFGRRVNLYMFTTSMLIAIILEIVSTNWQGYLAAKLMAGIACGFLGTTVMTYLSEIVMPMPQMRGSILAAFSFSWQIGALTSSIGLQILATTKPLAYRNIFYSEFAVFGLWLFALALLPESPAWLALNHKHDQGKKALKWLIGNVEGYDVIHEWAVLCSEIEETNISSKEQNHGDWAAMFKWKNFRRALISTLPYTYQNFIGVPLVFGQTTYFFQNAGLKDPFLGNLIIGLVALVSLASSLYLIERLGRRPLVLWGAAIMVVCDLLIGGLGIPTITPGIGVGLITLSAVWVFAFQTSLGPVGWAALVEISTPVLRAKTASIASILQSFSGVLFNYTVPLMLSNQYAGWGAKIGFLFGGLSIPYWFACYISFPETKNRTYAELDELFERRIPPRMFHKTKTVAEDNASLDP